MNETLAELGAAGAALAVAASSGLLEAIVERPGSPEQLAERLDLDPFATSRVLEVLRTRGLIARNGQGYQATETLKEEMRGPMGRPRLAWTIFAHAPGFLEDGSAALEASATASGRERVYPSVVPRLARLFEPAAEELASRLDEALSTPRTILDVGAGSGVWGLAQIARHPESQLVALDLPDVCEQFERRAKELGMSDRVRSLAGDMHEVDLKEASFDRVILANVLHLEPPDLARRLLWKMMRVVTPGGQVVIVDKMATDRPDRDRHHAAYAFFLALRIEGARPHPEAELRRWLTDAGAGVAPRIDLTAGPQGPSALVATRR
jgi:ubiquinone/menaquinone biosynthesis C-methylase UbiE